MTIPSAAPHPLDHVIWSALTTRHAPLAQGSPLAWCYPPEVAPFAALANRSEAAFESLHALMQPGERAVLFTVDAVEVPAQFTTLLEKFGEQMIATSYTPAAAVAEHLTLGPTDVTEMRALVALTRPGPFKERTIELGRYIGRRQDGQLVAMAGERMNIDGFTEVSAICTHPDHRGHGHAAALTDVIARGILARGDTPFLHVWADNASAIALYHKLGFSIRRTMHVTAVARAG